MKEGGPFKLSCPAPSVSRSGRVNCKACYRQVGKYYLGTKNHEGGDVEFLGKRRILASFGGVSRIVPESAREGGERWKRGGKRGLKKIKGKRVKRTTVRQCTVLSARWEARCAGGVKRGRGRKEKRRRCIKTHIRRDLASKRSESCAGYRHDKIKFVLEAGIK